MKPGLLTGLRSNQPMDCDFKVWNTRRKKPYFLSLHKHPCSFTCEDTLQQCSSAVLCWREMRSFLKPVLFPTTGVPHVPLASRCPNGWAPALNPSPVPRSSWSKVRGRKEASAFISVLCIKSERWKFLLSPSWRSLPWIPVWAKSSLFQFYLGYIWITLILCSSGSCCSVSHQRTKT